MSRWSASTICSVRPTHTAADHVRQPIFDMGRAAAQAILDLLAQRPPALPDFATELVIRESAILRR